MAALAEAGHHATYQSTKEPGFKKALKQPADLVLAARRAGARSRPEGPLRHRSGRYRRDPNSGDQ